MKVVLIGDRLTGAGYRLAGVDVRVTDADGVAEEFAAARPAADLVLITAPLSAYLSDEALTTAMRRAAPPVQVIAAVTDPRNAPDVRNRVRRSLGVGT
jgi:vacuolar-type H+-ATPase subunit F/Vma7